MKRGSTAEAYMRAVPRVRSRAPSPRRVGGAQPSQTRLPREAQGEQPRIKERIAQTIAKVVRRASKNARRHFCYCRPRVPCRG